MSEQRTSLRREKSGSLAKHSELTLHEVNAGCRRPLVPYAAMVAEADDDDADDVPTEPTYASKQYSMHLSF